MTLMDTPILGIDISKVKFDVALLFSGKVKKTRVFDNNLLDLRLYPCG